MIPNPILINSDGIMISIVLCCVLILAVVMVPKAIRHRKQVKQKECEESVPQEQEVEIIIIPEKDMKNSKKQSFDYRKAFLIAPKLEDRKPVFISRTTRDSLDKIARRLGDRKMSVSGFLENMANHHLEEYADEINRLYKE